MRLRHDLTVMRLFTAISQRMVGRGYLLAAFCPSDYAGLRI